MRKRADALANAGRAADAGRTYEQAAAETVDDQQVELLRLAALQYLFAGLVKQGRRLLQSVLQQAGMRLPRGPRHALIRWLGLRTILKARGLRYELKKTPSTSAQVFRRVDTCWTAAAGLGIIDPISAACFQTRGLILALRTGEPTLIARSLCMEAAQLSLRGGAAKNQVDSLLDRARTIAGRIDQPYLNGLILLAEGISEVNQGHWCGAQLRCDEAEQTFREQCIGVTWEIDCATAVAATALLDAGQIQQLASRLPALRERARKRGNLLALTAPSSMNLPSLARDQPQEARQILGVCMQHWADEEHFYVQHFSALYDQIQTDLYEGDPVSAWSKISDRRQAVVRSLLTRVQLSRGFSYQTRARCALAMAAQVADPRRWLRVAERDARRLEREGQAWTRPLAELLLAGVAASRRQLPEAIALLENAVVHFDKVDMVLYAAVARHQLSVLVEGSAAKAAAAAAQRWMQEQGIVKPERFCRLFAPGFPMEPP
jgi:hypothetical protein